MGLGYLPGMPSAVAFVSFDIILFFAVWLHHPDARCVAHVIRQAAKSVFFQCIQFNQVGAEVCALRKCTSLVSFCGYSLRTNL